MFFEIANSDFKFIANISKKSIQASGFLKRGKEVCMQGITYEWKINFAVIVSALSPLVTIILWKLNEHKKLKSDRKRVYEEIYEDVCFILCFPITCRDRKIKEITYSNEDPELERAVRMYIDSHWMDQYWGRAKFIPSHIKDEHQKLEFMRRVQDEANNFSDKLFEKNFSFSKLSPVFYLDEPKIDKRLKRIIKYIGRSLSLFSEEISQLWESARISNPFDVQREYEKALQFCKNYFDHNPRDFDDPFYDLLKCIRQEYRVMTRTRKQKIGELIWEIKRLLWKIRHPIKCYQMKKQTSLEM